MRPYASGRPRRRRRAALVVAAGLLLGGVTLPAVADPGSDDDGGTPSKAEVDAARDAVADQERTVAAVRTDLLLANQRLESAAIRVAQAGEAWNAARWKLGEARAAARAAVHRQALAERSLARHQRLFDQVIAASYESSPELSALSALADEHGLDGLAQAADATYQLTSSLSDIQDDYEAAAEVADLAGDEAQDARAAAEELAEEAAAARADALAEADRAAAQSSRIAERKRQLLTELAELQDISVSLATRRQADLEAAAQAQAAAAAAAEQAEQEQQEQEEQQETEQPDAGPGDQPDPQPEPDPEPDPDPQPDPEPPAPSGGAGAAISFARDQLGEPYRWGAAGPDAWDCSGLTMRAWRAGGTSLPHYSAGQYTAATPISSGDLRPGDLVFWGSSSSPRSIYHVALYLGDSRIIHAPRTGRPVTEDSMYYWVPPTFFARP